jgi:hypothetical protein
LERDIAEKVGAVSGFADPLLWNLPPNLSPFAKCIALTSLHFLILGSDSRNTPRGTALRGVATENRSVGGSIPPLGTIGINKIKAIESRQSD